MGGQREFDELESQLLRLKFAGEQTEQEIRTRQIGETAAGNNFVLVLINGHSHHLNSIPKFQDDLLRANGKGGAEASHLLDTEIRKYVSKTLMIPEAFHLIIRVYVDLKELSKDAWRAKLVDATPRALGSFAGSFSNAFGFFDFINVGNRNGVQTKIQEAFKYYVKDPLCQHIFLGPPFTASYNDLLKTHNGKATVIRGDLNNFQPPDCKFVSFPSVFRMSKPPILQSFPTGRNGRLATGNTSGHHNGQMCRDSQKLTEPRLERPLYLRWREQVRKMQKHPPSRMPLPRWGVPGMIPLNANNERLDISIRTPTATGWNIYNTRVNVNKLCNNFHLLGKCTAKSSWVKPGGGNQGEGNSFGMWSEELDAGSKGDGHPHSQLHERINTTLMLDKPLIDV
ncbi:uncharacterized protein BDR25DRAFT_315994 [Lindgomyces ingoldianus]|uniref:Uncharacterized protein n=1 Tax=Lindgomyces ingoldianus TaxID=673940 RepID=A0ACB6QQS2_9PLEO|nr:uncharacterized protein BDR25DRAFT_315994 [Lindgomyces ingoldianus]KAF2468516.1 hypothetical protein BDR25DRAFT_315994 [Lindgomyces ingoldianus]